MLAATVDSNFDYPQWTELVQLTDLHGDILATDYSTGYNAWSLQNIYRYTESGAAESGTVSPATSNDNAYGWLGGDQISGTTLGGTLLMGACAYSPGTGRFDKVDPVYGGSANAYDYALQNSVTKTDLTGTSFQGAATISLFYEWPSLVAADEMGRGLGSDLLAGLPPAVGMAAGVRLGPEHFGIEMRSGGVCENSPAGIRIVSFSDFARGGPTTVKNPYATPDDRERAVARAESRIGEHRYSLTANKREHFASWCATGVAISHQVIAFMAALARMVFAAAFSLLAVSLTRTALAG